MFQYKPALLLAMAQNFPRRGNPERIMSKLLLVLCLIIGSYTAHASVSDSVKEKLEAAKEKVMELINAAYEAVKDALQNAKDTLVDWGKQAEEKAEEIIKALTDKIEEALQKLDEKIDEWAGKAGDEGVDVTECTKLTDEVRGAAVKIITNASACAADKIAEGSEYIEDINRISDELFANLTVINQEASECFDNVEGFTDTANALACMTKALGKAALAVAYEVPALLKDVAKLTYEAITIIPSMSVCSVTTSVKAFLENVDKVADQIQSCIDQKISESKSTTAVPQY